MLSVSTLTHAQHSINKSIDLLLIDVIDLDVAIVVPDKQAGSQGVPGNGGH